MAIVSSTIIEDAVQIDGRRHVLERHTDAQGAVRDVRYMAEAAADIVAAMNARVAIINAQITADELATNVNQALGETL